MKKIKSNIMPVMALLAFFIFMFMCVVMACAEPNNTYRYDYRNGGDLTAINDSTYYLDYCQDEHYVDVQLDNYTAHLFMRIQDLYEDENLYYKGLHVNDYEALCIYMTSMFHIEVIDDELWLKINK